MFIRRIFCLAVYNTWCESTTFFVRANGPDACLVTRYLQYVGNALPRDWSASIFSLLCNKFFLTKKIKGKNGWRLLVLLLYEWIPKARDDLMNEKFRCYLILPVDCSVERSHRKYKELKCVFISSCTWCSIVDSSRLDTIKLDSV